MIVGAHMVVFSPEAGRVRSFLAEVLGFDSVDAGGGWLIFALPPAELAVHPSDGEARHALYLMCEDINDTVAELRDKGVEFTRPISEERWGLVTAFALPGGGEIGLYEPRHASPIVP